MLTDEQKAAIKAEEIFREGVRREIAANAPAPSVSARLWAGLNSSFFLWCMSSIVVAVVSFLYQENTASRAQRTAQQDTIRRLDAELSSRLYFFGRQILSGDPEKNAVNALNNPQLTSMASGVFPEYANRPLRALLWELQANVPALEQEEVQKALKQCDNLVKIYFAANNEKLLVSESAITIQIGTDPILDEFFGDLDRAAGPAKNPPPAGATSPPPEKVKAKPSIPPTNLHFVATLFDYKNPVLKAFNTIRWNLPFSGLQNEWLEQLKSKDPAAYKLLTDSSSKYRLD